MSETIEQINLQQFTALWDGDSSKGAWDSIHPEFNKGKKVSICELAGVDIKCANYQYYTLPMKDRLKMLDVVNAMPKKLEVKEEFQDELWPVEDTFEPETRSI